MFQFFRKNPGRSESKTGQSGPDHGEEDLSSSLEDNVAAVRRLFADVDILRAKYVDNTHDKGFKCCLLYCDGMVDATMVNESLIKPLMLSRSAAGGNTLDVLMTQVVQVGEGCKSQSLIELAEGIAYGDTALFVEGESQAILFNTKGFQTRAITEPDNEKNLYGPREGFTECLMVNLSMLRRKLLCPDLKLKFLTVGSRTRTKVCVCYMEGIVDRAVLTELYRRLEAIDIDAVLDANYITELIRDKPWSTFRTVGDTERPDTLAAKILEGRVGIILDGTPMALTVPYLFIESFQSAEDYYVNYYYSTFTRWLRMMGFFLTITVPGLYVAIVGFHHEMLPFQLFVNITSERTSVPLPAAVEAFAMILVFDILKEAGARMPSNVGQALSIVGALVIGQAAVEAKLVAAPMIIVVALTGITSMLTPRLSASAIYIRLGLLALASTFGFFGLLVGLSILLIHIINLRSFGVPEVMLTGELRHQDLKDTVMRAPWWQMQLRPEIAADRDRMGNEEDRHE
ncbi:putative membrane protein [uncultured Eubacteriales bacterium]|uniref:Putative membrane protein n=1 Tax=uncultured Eubacteriales bacterium TaxID=172733 RepID=A0A212KH55_9FIRM|nr:putative membrane protein [uncultured Eubacteriales bacterium]